MEQEQRFIELEARVELLREMVRELIARHPADSSEDAQMYAAIKRYNQGGSSGPEKSARDAAYKWFNFSHIHRVG